MQMPNNRTDRADTVARSPFQPEVPQAGETLIWGRLYGDAPGLAIAEAARRHPGPVLVTTPDTQTAARLESQLQFFARDDGLNILQFPDWETLPYDLFSPHQDIISQRLETLYRLPSLRTGVLIVPVTTLMQRLAPSEYLQANSLLLEVGERLDPEATRLRLEQAGYRYVSQVMEHGEFTVRGSLLDLFPMGSAMPYRIDLFDDEVESIRTFDPENQRTVGKVESIRLLPAREFPMTEEAIQRFRHAYRVRFEGDPQRSLIYRDVSQGHTPGGIEYYLPLFHERCQALSDYLPSSTLLITVQGACEAAEQFWGQVAQRYEQRRYDSERPLLEPAEIYLEPEHLWQSFAGSPDVALQRFEVEPNTAGERRYVNFATGAAPKVPLQPRAGEPAAALKTFLDHFGGRVLFTAESAGRREVLLDTVHAFGLFPRSFESWREFLDADAELAVVIAPLEQGLLLDDPAIAVISEAQLFGERVLQQRRRKRPSREAENAIRNLTDLDVGAPVVHEDHGVGRYLGLQKLSVGGIDAEFLTLEYSGGDKLYVPVASLHLVSRYTGAAPESAPLHKLGGEQWQRIKRKAAEKVRDVAAELLDIHAQRAARQGHAYATHADEYAAFAAAFPFEETPDQQNAIDAVLADMAAGQPMDRLVCGDVGFGKTEVAMRAAFVAVQDNRQVAVLVPTTLLAQQHYQNFQDRFADWPVRVEVLSRFRSKKEHDAILPDLANGKVDIIIGTHKLLQSDVKFKNLGLAIVDEEHRFGVRQKERLKALRAEVDILTLTATPIPRTLNMSLSGLRDLSIIATPPSERVAIKTFVSEWNDSLIQEAFQRELKRGGQVYVLHNDVATIERRARELREMVAGANVRVAHGQMRERELEQVMLDFYHQRFNVLVCSTIIESGIDVPSANTIIIERADKFGLAQLHQLRGRVGRSHHRAYAYLLIPGRKAMTTDAVKRLEAIESLEDLGAGFMLATHDLEIRGAGELLGEDQSGQIQEIGFNLYNELLERAVQALKSGREPALDAPLHQGPEVDLHVPTLLPEDYLPDIHARLIMYKRIASAANRDELRDLQVEMIDRFGLLPTPAKQLIRATELKLRAEPLGVTKIDIGPKGGRIIFGHEPNVDLYKIIQLVQQQPDTYKLDGQDKLRLQMPLDEVDLRFQTVQELLDSIRADAPRAAQG
ncbi:MAG: transcription-repair coupling factor [Gammaproteobacteria bacterium]